MKYRTHFSEWIQHCMLHHAHTLIVIYIFYHHDYHEYPVNDTSCPGAGWDLRYPKHMAVKTPRCDWLTYQCLLLQVWVQNSSIIHSHHYTDTLGCPDIQLNQWFCDPVPGQDDSDWSKVFILKNSTNPGITLFHFKVFGFNFFVCCQRRCTVHNWPRVSCFVSVVSFRGFVTCFKIGFRWYMFFAHVWCFPCVFSVSVAFLRWKTVLLFSLHFFVTLISAWSFAVFVLCLRSFLCLKFDIMLT